MNKLRISLNFESTESTEKEKWYSIIFEIVKSDIPKTLKIIDIYIEYNDALEYLKWVIENEFYLINDEFVIDVEFHKTIAKSIFNFYDQFEDTNDLNELNRLYKYRERHGLRFALRGYDVADIYIGKVGEYHTISLCDKENDWSYNIDMRQFIIDCKKMY